MATLLSETIEVLRINDKVPEDVLFVQTTKHEWVGGELRGGFNQQGTWNDFAALADFPYDSGYGGNEIELSLKIVGDSWWLERAEYDGSEWWDFKTLPAQLSGAPPLATVKET